MYVKQISVFLENKSGRLAEVSTTLAQAKINIRALSIADTTDFGILRLIVNQPDLACTVLQANGFTVSTTDVIAVAVPDQPGGLSKVLEALAGSTVNLEYMYAFLAKQQGNALVVFRVDDVEQAIEVMRRDGIEVLPSEQVYAV
ncbi:MAG: ACT domain-containing protein [Peptococcaceae bacterium]|nr:ACT domain-containing protein [Peptococcaceae bacterium]